MKVRGHLTSQSYPRSGEATMYNNNYPDGIKFFYVDDKALKNLYINDKIIDFGQKANDITKGYERFNVVSETGDSIYSLTLEELIIAEKRKGQVYVSEDYMREIRREVDIRSDNKAEADL